jgi:hypothetical protein
MQRCTIEHLEVMFEAERDKDEARFAELFASHMRRHEQERRSRQAQAAQADRDRSLEIGSPW